MNIIKTVPYIQTIGSEKFREFLTQPFYFNQLHSFEDHQILFDGWRSKDMGTWFKYINDDDFLLEVYAETYTIKTKMNIKNKSFILPHPCTINDFINDMDRFGIQLYWNEWIPENFNPKDYLKEDEIRNYYVTLLGRLDKSFELQ